MISDTLVAVMPFCWQKSNASGLSSSVGSPLSSTTHCGNGEKGHYCVCFIYLAAVTVCRKWRPGYFEREQHGEELELVSDQHGVADDGHLGLQGILDGNRRDVLSAGGDDQFCTKKTI